MQSSFERVEEGVLMSICRRMPFNFKEIVHLFIVRVIIIIMNKEYISVLVKKNMLYVCLPIWLCLWIVYLQSNPLNLKKYVGKTFTYMEEATEYNDGMPAGKNKHSNHKCKQRVYEGHMKDMAMCNLNRL